MRSILHNIGNDAGVTFIELMVALSLASLLSVFIISANLFVNRVLTEWRNNNTIYEDGRFIISRLSEDIRSSLTIIHSDSTSYTIVTGKGDTTSYQIDRGVIIRNKKILNSPGVICDSLKLIRKFFEKSTPDSILINGRSSYLDELIEIDIYLSYKTLSKFFETSVRPKNASYIF